MRTQLTIAALLFSASLLLPSRARAQQTPAPQNPAPSSAAKPAAPSSSASKPATKPGAASTAKRAAAVPLKSQIDKSSYALGLNVGRSLQRSSISAKDLNTAIFMQGFRDALAGRKPLLTDAEVQAALAVLQAGARKEMDEKNAAAAAVNRKAGDAFLAANRAKDGVVTLPSGLQYKILKQGDGPKPAAADTVLCNYRGTLLDGTEFDSSYKRGQPARFPVGGVIKGWTEALQLMPVGSKWQLFIPPDLAYGNRGAGSVIAPGDTLIFEVELLSIEPKPASPPAPK
jgi:FKBP-type peptidyl-prolyl cis-trans isomerase FklB